MDKQSYINSAIAYCENNAAAKKGDEDNMLDNNTESHEDVTPLNLMIQNDTGTQFVNACGMGRNVLDNREKFESDDISTIEITPFFKAEGNQHTIINDGRPLVVTGSIYEDENYYYDVIGNAHVDGEVFSNEMNTQKDNERHIKATEAKEQNERANPIDEMNSLTMTDEPINSVKVGLKRKTSFEGAEIKTSDDGGYQANFKIGHVNADLTATLKDDKTSERHTSMLNVNAGVGLDVALIEGNFAHKSKCDVSRITSDDNEIKYPTCEKAVEINAEAQTDGKICLGRATGFLNYSSKPEKPTANVQDEGQCFDITLADIEFDQESQCMIEANASYTDLRIEAEHGHKRETKIHAKAGGSISATSEGHASLNMLEQEVAKIEYNAKVIGEGNAEFRGYEITRNDNPTEHEQQIKVCTGSAEATLNEEARVDAELNLLKLKVNPEAETKTQGETNAHFTLAEAKKTQDGEHKQGEFRLIDGKAEGKVKSYGKAILGKLGFGFDAEAQGEAEHCLAKGNANFNAKNPNKSDVNVTLGKAGAKGGAKFGINVNKKGKKYGRKFEVSGEAKVSPVDDLRAMATGKLPKLTDIKSLAPLKVKFKFK